MSLFTTCMPRFVRTNTRSVSLSSADGRDIRNNLGSPRRKKLRTQGDIRCVAGERKCTLMTTTVTTIERVTRHMVKRRYWPMRGTTMEVGGMISARRRKKTVRERRIEMQRAIFSLLSLGR